MIVFLAGNSLSIVKYTTYRKKSLGNSLNSNIVKILIVVSFIREIKIFFMLDFDEKNYTYFYTFIPSQILE